MTSSFNFTSKPKGALENTLGMYKPQGGTGSMPRGMGFSDGRSYTREMQPGMMVENRLESLANSRGNYMTNARQRGLEQAASRGNLNSSIAAGASERAALEAALPIASQDAQTEFALGSENMGAMNQNLMQERQLGNQLVSDRLAAGTQSGIAQMNNAGALQRQRENLAYEGEQAGLTRAQQLELLERGYQHDLGRIGADYTYRDAFANNDTMRQNWLNDQTFTREFEGSLAMLPIASMSQFMNSLTQRMIDEPDVYTPAYVDQITGFTEDYMDYYFNNMFSGFGGGG